MEIRSISAINTERLPAWGRKIAFALAAVIAAYALTQLVRLLTGSVAPATARTPASEIAALDAPSEVAVHPVEEVYSAQQPKLKLKLVGTLTAGEGHGSALIASDSGDEKVFFVGDTVPGNSKLKAVYKDRVLLESGRGQETLRLSKEIKPSNFVDGPSQAPGQSALSDADMAEYFLPATSPTGELIGYRLSPDNHQARFQQLGLLPTDIITAVHGLPLVQPESRLRALQRLKSDEFASITFVRDGNKLINITIMPDVEIKAAE